MALTVKYTATRSSDYKSLSIVDNGTEWGVGGEPDTGDVTAISLVVYSSDDSVTPLHTVDFTAGEISSFTTGGTVTILSTDSRWFTTPYFVDGFYNTSLDVSVSAGDTISTYQVYESTFYIRKLIYKDVMNVILPVTTFYDANARITGNITSLYMLDELSNGLTIARQNQWLKVYNFLENNFNQL